MIIKYIASIILTVSCQTIFSQIIDNDQAHPSVKWKQIEDKNFRLIFPSETETAALNLAKSLPSLIHKNDAYFGIKSKRTPIILQGNHVTQNGFVQLAPRKSELFPIPSATPDNQQWLPNLAIHELRHIGQFDKMTGKLTRPFFEQLAFALYGLNLPAWYFEGDAVLSETINSNGGRGRLPSWEMPLRANILSGKRYSFNKYILGSYKDNIPSYYTIGYFMNSYISNHFTINSANEILSQMQGKLVRPFNFSKALKTQTGETPTSIYQKTIHELSEKWRNEEPLIREHLDTVPTSKSKYPSDYLIPQSDAEHNLYALYRSPESVNKIVKIHDGKHLEIVKTGLQIDPHFHIRGNKIVWDEYRKDPRFGKQTYSIINVYDIETKRLNTISKKSRYYAPSLHPNLDKIVTVEVTKNLTSRIILLDATSGKVVDSIPSVKDTHLQQPKFNESGTHVVAIAVSQLGTNLIEFDLHNKQFRYLLEWGNQQLERPFYYKNKIIFKAHYDGIDNIYSTSSDGKISKISNSRFGAFNPSINQKGEFYYNDYQFNGYKIVKTNPNIEHDDDNIIRSLYIQPTLEQDYINQGLIPIDTAKESFLVTDYQPANDLINFHSLSISSTNFESFDNYIPGIFWISNDILNTTQLKLGYEYDPELHKSHYSAEISYRKYFPILTVSYANRGLSGNAVNANEPEKIVMYDYRQNEVSFDISLPFSIYRQNTVYSYGANFGTSFTNRYDMSIDLKNFTKNIAFPLNYQVYFNRNNMRSKMDLAPKWGQNFSITYRHLPFENKLDGQIFSARMNFYFPALKTNHSLQIRAGLQKGTGRYEGVYDIPMVSGWGYFESPIVTNTLSLTYKLPLFYPDWNIGSIAFIKRFQGFAFSDFQNTQNDTDPKSFGLGISADLNVFRYVLPDINIGTKATYINDKTATQKIVPSFSISYSY